MTNVVDLTATEPDADLPEVEAKPLGTVPYDPEPDREKVRGNIAYLLTALLIFVVMFVAGMSWLKKPSPNLSSLTAALITPIIGVTGIVFGFYYAGKGTSAK